MNDKELLIQALNKLRLATGLDISLDFNINDDLQFAVDQLTRLVKAYKEKYNSEYVLYNAMLANTETPGKVLEEKLHIKNTSLWILFLVQWKSASSDIPYVLQKLFPKSSGNFIIQISPVSQAILHPTRKQLSGNELKTKADSILNSIVSEAMDNAIVSYSSYFDDLSDLNRSYKEATAAYDIGTKFFPEEHVFSYSDLGLGILLNDISTASAKKYLFEVFGTEDPQILDKDFICLFETFSKNNFNLATTSRELHMHRNTLIYKIDRFKEKTGIDIKNFDNAVALKLSIRLLNFLKGDASK